jgi:cell division septum initiation protein DivIVA
MANNTISNPRSNDVRTGGPGNPQSAADKARDVARETVESARDAASGVVDRARDMAGSVADTARDWAAGAAGAVKDNANKAGEYVQEAWDTGSRYVQEHDIKDMTEDVAGVIRRNPIPALLVGIGLGFILGRALRS